MTEQAKLFFRNNQNLFSNNYLEHRLPSSALWTNQRTNAEKVFEDIKKYYESIRGLNLGPGQEAELEDKFIRPVLKALGFAYNVQPPTRRGYKKKRPDYALFKSDDDYKTAIAEKENERKFFSHALTIMEAKYWGRRLNDTDKDDRLDSRDPTAQTIKYLDDVNYHSEGKINWAILSNGKAWRLFYYRAATRSGNFYEIDLEEVIARNDLNAFLYFYLFFSKGAFLLAPVTGKTWLDQHLKGSEEYAARVSTKLKDLIFDKVFEGLAEGFVHFRRNELAIQKETDASKKDIFKGCLTLLYRLLFLLYAESRNLLPVGEDAYDRVSLSSLKRDISKDISNVGLDKMSKKSFTYWSRLEGIFDIIAMGDQALNVPIYNGGLFETPKKSFLEIHKMPDSFLAQAIEFLTVDHEDEHRRDEVPFIDYSSLSVRHLGDIYEGLLEFHVQIAEENIVEVRKDGKALWQKEVDAKEGVKTYRTKSKGDVFIENSKHERKATGSYYTPHYIVEYIVKNTVGPVIDERLKTVDGLLTELEETNKALRRQKGTAEIQGYRAKRFELEDNIFDTLFGAKVLDPAMGSGHFLVHAVDFITDRLIACLASYPDSPVLKKIAEMKSDILAEVGRQGVKIDESRLTEVNLIKRMVMKRCIYGVDLNEMAVELAKLSLWLDSFTLGAPLSFLDHHLKCGNSLVGTNIDELEKALSGHLFAVNLEPLKRAIRDMIFISDLPDATFAQVKESYEKFGEANRGLEGYRVLLDMLIAEYFGIADARKLLVSDFDRIDLNRLDESLKTLPAKDRKAIENVERVSHEKRFFHWEIEFPEVFYERTGEFEQKIEKKENPGFDCVIGNPPYGLLSKDGYFKQSYSFVNPSWDIYVAFIERGITVVGPNRFVSYIVPVSWETGAMFERLREFLIERTSIKKIINLPFDVFKDAYIDTSIFVIENFENAANKALAYEFPKKARIDKLDEIEYREIEQSRWSGNKKQIILESHVLQMLPRLFRSCLKLGDIAASVRGVLASSEFLSDNPKSGYDQFFDGEMIRYQISEPDKYIRYSDELPEKPADIDFFKEARVLVRRLVSRQDRLMAAYASNFFINKKDIYIFKAKVQNYLPQYLLSLLNSKFLSFLYLSQDTISKKDDFRQATLEGIRSLPIPRISFTTPKKERRERVVRAIELYEKYMVELEQKEDANEKREASAEHNRAVGEPVAGGKEGKVSGEHTGAGIRIHGVRRRARKHYDAEGVHEESEEYSPPSRSTRYIESSLGIKSYSELAPYLAKEVERVMASLLDKASDELKITPEFICGLHKDAFEGLFPSWAGRYRDRNVKVGNYDPPPYYEVPVLMRSYCDDLEFRLSSLGAKPLALAALVQAFAFAEGRLLSIHPFRDFNGRVTRMLLFSLLCRFDLPPVRLVPDEKDKTETEAYLEALTEADRMNWQPLIMIWRKRVGLEAEE